MPQLPGKYCLSPVLAAHHTVLMFTKKWSVPLAAAILDSEKAPGVFIPAPSVKFNGIVAQYCALSFELPEDERCGVGGALFMLGI